MTPEFAYFLKVNVAFVLLYAFYRLFFYKDTFFKLRRIILLAFFGLSFLYPLLNIQDWVKSQEPMVEVIQMYSAILPEAVISPVVAQETDWHSLILSGFFYMYWGGVILLLLRFSVQLSGLLLLARKSRRVNMHGVPVHLLDKPAGPFSFFQFIFLYPKSHSEKEIDEILTHECTHVFQWHSIDVIICELISIICWVNPFVWLLKREVRHNLEYLADNTVLESGFDCRSYQYHLLGLAHHNKSTATLYNSFNVLHLKYRISMMNKKRSRGIGRTKYLALIPMAACLMLLSNIDALARITGELTENVTAEMRLSSNDKVKVTAQVIDGNRKPVVGVNVIVKGTTIGTISDQDGNFVIETSGDAILQISYFGLQMREMAVKDFKANMKIQLLSDGKQEGMQDLAIVPAIVKNGTVPSGQVFTIVDKMPSFPGGEGAMLKYLSQNVKYPVIAQQQGIQGRVSCSFVVNADGTIRDIEVLRGVDPLLDAEALRVLGLMPTWIPGQQRGENVAVKYTVPISFRLSEKSAVRHQEDTAVNAESSDASGQVFTVVEKMPQFPGGEGQLIKYLADNVKYPQDARENSTQGRVSCQFIVSADGSIRDVKVIRGVSPTLDAEALRLVSTMPRWIPGTQRNKAVQVKYTVPVTFRLE